MKLFVLLSMAGMALGIYDGELATAGEIPFAAAVYRDSKMCCGASILNAYFIITAASCIQGFSESSAFPASRLSVRVGSLRYNTGGVLMPVAETFLHPNFVPGGVDSDVALLKLANPISFNNNTQPILLSDSPTIQSGDVTIAGYGDTRRFRILPAYSALHKASAPIAPRSTCALLHPLAGKDNIFCTVAVIGPSPCSGDGGSPAYIVDDTRPTMLAGIACAETLSTVCNAFAPSVYTSIPPFREWINNILATQTP